MKRIGRFLRILLADLLLDLSEWVDPYPVLWEPCEPGQVHQARSR